MSRVGEDTNSAAKGRDYGDCVIGEIQLTAGNITAGGMPANGQELAISQYDALFTLIGATYGGNGVTTFALPDLRALAPDHMTYSICAEGIYPSSGLDRRHAHRASSAARSSVGARSSRLSTIAVLTSADVARTPAGSCRAGARARGSYSSASRPTSLREPEQALEQLARLVAAPMQRAGCRRARTCRRGRRPRPAAGRRSASSCRIAQHEAVDASARARSPRRCRRTRGSSAAGSRPAGSAAGSRRAPREP